MNSSEKPSYNTSDNSISSDATSSQHLSQTNDFIHPSLEYNTSYNSLLEQWAADIPSPPPVYSPTEENASVISRQLSSEVFRFTERLQPQHCKAGYACVGVGDCSDIDQICVWRTQFVDVRESFMYIAQAKDKRENQIRVSLKKRYVSLARRRVVAVHGGPNTILIKCNSEVQAYRWLLTLSQYCFVAPTMEGFCDKLSKRKEVFEQRYLRLGSDGVLSWFHSDHNESDLRGAIQMRGVPSSVDNIVPEIIHVHVESRDYKFRFSTSREAELWLAAFQWHYGRKELRSSSVNLRNKAKQ